MNREINHLTYRNSYAGMAELVDAPDLGFAFPCPRSSRLVGPSCPFRRESTQRDNWPGTLVPINRPQFRPIGYAVATGVPHAPGEGKCVQPVHLPRPGGLVRYGTDVALPDFYFTLWAGGIS